MLISVGCEAVVDARFGKIWRIFYTLLMPIDYGLTNNARHQYTHEVQISMIDFKSQVSFG